MKYFDWIPIQTFKLMFLIADVKLGLKNRRAYLTLKSVKVLDNCSARVIQLPLSITLRGEFIGLDFVPNCQDEL